MSAPREVLLKCGDCGGDFPWTPREQEFYRERDFPPPKRCKECRQVNQKRFGGQQAGEGRGGKK